MYAMYAMYAMIFKRCNTVTFFKNSCYKNVTVFFAFNPLSLLLLLLFVTVTNKKEKEDTCI